MKTSREKKLAKNTLIISVGKVCTQLISFLLLPLYTGILSTGEYGIVDFLNTIVSLCLPIATLQIEQSLFRNLIDVRDDEIKTKKIISNGIIIIIDQCILFLILFFIIAPFVNNNYKYFIIMNLFAYVFSSLFLQIARGLDNNKSYSIGSFISAFTTILFNILFILIIKLGAYGMLIGTFLGQMSVVIYLFFSLKIYKFFSFKFSDKILSKKLLKYSVPLIPNAISWWVFNASDRVIVTAILGVDINGILAAALKFSGVYITLYNIFNISWTESIAASINDKDVSLFFNKMFDIILRLFISLAVGIISVMPFVYPILINNKFNDGYVLVPISIIASLFNVVVGLVSVIYVGHKNTKAIANTSIISAIINIIVHLLLIKFINLYAAVISTLVSFLVMSIYRIYDINKKYFKIIINKKIIIYTSIVMIVVLYLYYLNNIYLNIFSLLITIVFCIIINKNSITIILDIIKNKFRNKV